MTPAPAAPARILFADDEPVFLSATAELLRLEGYEVETARSGQEGAALLAGSPFDILLSDVKMPGNENLEFVHQAVRANPGLRVILVTGFPSVDTAMQAIRLPVVAYLTKPVATEDLLSQLVQATGGLRIQKAAAASRERLMRWVEEVDETLNGLNGSRRIPDREAARLVLGQALGNIAGVLLDLKALFDLSLDQGPGKETCTVRSCPRLAESHFALKEAVQVIEQTKNSFKSRELGELRERLRGVLVSQAPN